MRFAYHYHAITQISKSETVHIDGIITCETKIDTMERYHEVKKVIAGDQWFPEDLAVDSLSLLHSLD